MDTREIVENFPPNQVIKQVAEGKASLPRDPTKRAIYEAQLQRYEDNQERKAEAGKSAGQADSANPSGSGDGMKPADPEESRRRAERQSANVKAQELLDLPPDQRMKEILRMSPEEQRALAGVAKGAKADALMEGMSPQQKETLMALNNPEQVVVGELMQAKLLRAIYSERQLR